MNASFQASAHPSLVQRRTAIAWIGSTLVALGGCATRAVAPPSSEPFWSGRLSLQIDSQPPERLSAAFELEGQPERGQLRLLTPLGQILARARWQPGAANLERNGQNTPYADVATLLTELTGAPLPLDALFAWLGGHPMPAEGWQVDLSQRANGRLRATRLQPSPTAQLTLVLE